MCKNDLIISTAKTLNLSEKLVKSVVDTFLNSTADAFPKNTAIKLQSFGTFKLIRRKQRYARNVAKNIPISIPEHYTVKFYPSEYLKSVANAIPL